MANGIASTTTNKLNNTCGDAEQIVGREPRERVSQDVLLNSQLALPRGRVNSAVMPCRYHNRDV